MRIYIVVMVLIPSLGFAQITDLPSILFDYGSETYSGVKNENAPAELDDFAFMIGEWEVVRKSKNADGTYSTNATNAYWRASYVLNGTAILDEWKASSSGGEQLGITLRTFDPNEKSWTCMWYDNAFKKWIRYTASRSGENMVMYGQAPKTAYQGEGGDMRITFYEIQKDSFEWKMDWRSDNAEAWDEGRVLLFATRIP